MKFLILGASLIFIFKYGRTKPMTLDNVYKTYYEKVLPVAFKYNVPPSIVLGVIHKESAGVPHATGSVGEVGLGQILTPALTDYNNNIGTNLTLADMFDINNNIEVMTWYLSYLKGRFFDNWHNVLRAYNAGIGKVRASSTISQPYAEDVEHNQSILKQKYNIL